MPSRYNMLSSFKVKSSLNPLVILLFFLAAGHLNQATGQDAAPLVVMNLAAHPDDEDGRTLTYYRNAKNAIAYSVIYTRGEGGQNEIGPELYEELGAIRTNETERAARILGTQTYFLNFKDFGYSKKASEAFEFWGGQDAVTARITYLIRKLKPDVLFTNHDTLTVGPRTQHGQHQAVGISAYNAFALAADPTYHPEQLEEEGVDLWQPKRLFLRLWSQQGNDYDVVLGTSKRDDQKGKTYGEIATLALYEHASQGMAGSIGFRRMDQDLSYSLLRSATDAKLDSTDLASNLPPNTAAKPDIRYWIDSGRIDQPADNFILANDEVVVPGQSVELTVDASQFDFPIKLVLSGPIKATLDFKGHGTESFSVMVSEDAVPTIPEPAYQYERFINSPPVVYSVYNKDTDALVAAGYLRMSVAPQVVLTSTQDVVRLKPGENKIEVLLSQFDPMADVLNLQLAVTREDNREVILQKPFEAAFEGTTILSRKLDFNLPENLKDGNYTISVTGLPEKASTAVKPANIFVAGRVFSVKVADNLRVGVIESYDNTLAQALGELDVDYVLLDSTALANKTYTDLHTILIDIRAYLVRADLRDHNQDLLEWVHDGGNLIVNYQKMFEWNAEFADPFNPELRNEGNFPPYPLVLSRDRITTEDSPVKVLKPDLSIFHTPNEITDALWDNWVQERGLYFPGEYDEKYQELFEMNDPGEAPLRSSTLMTEYGDGTYMYTALGWYRQLKAYHAGVYAFFANLISQPLSNSRM